MRLLPAICGIAPALLLTACADFGSVDGKKKLSPTELRFQAVEAKLAEVSRRTDSLNQVLLDGGPARTEDELRGLRGDVEKLRFDLEGQDKRAKDLYQDLDRRLARLEGGASMTIAPVDSTAAAGSSGAVVSGAVGGGMPSSPPVAPVQQEEAAYLQAFDQLKAGKYDDAIRGFKGVADTWPRGNYTDNALYWMGEAYYVKREYPSAIQSFQAVVDRFPASAKAADALLKQGLSYGENKQRDQARAAFQRVVKDYPGSNAANLAKQRLAQP